MAEIFFAIFHLLIVDFQKDIRNNGFYQITLDETLERFGGDVLAPAQYVRDWVTQLGVDTHYQDPLAQLALTTPGQEALFEAFNDLAPHWLALGGGGYNLGVVPRAWTLAFGVMSGQTFPDELPSQYQEDYHDERLRDQGLVHWSEANAERTHAPVAKVVAAVKQRHEIE